MKPREFQQQRRVREITDQPEEVIERWVTSAITGREKEIRRDIATKAKLTPTALGNAVREKRNGRSIRELAQELGEAHTNIQYVELGRMPRPQLDRKSVV